MPLRLPTLIEIETEEHGPITLRAYLSIKNLWNPVDDAELTTREFVVKVIHELMHSDGFSVEDINSWSDTLLEKIVRTWSTEKEGVKWEFEQDISPFEAFQKNYKTKIDNFREKDQADEFLYRNHIEESLRQIAQADSVSSLQAEVFGKDFRAQAELARMSASFDTAIYAAQAKALSEDFKAQREFAWIAGQANSFAMSATELRIVNEASRAQRELSRLAAHSSLDTSMLAALASESKAVDAAIRAQYELGKVVGKNIQDAFASIAGIADSFQENVEAIAKSLKFEIQAQNLFEDLPNIAKAQRQFALFEKLSNILERIGYPASTAHWAIELEPISFAYADKLSLKVLDAVIANKLLYITRKNEFNIMINGHFQTSPILKRRWNIIEQALKAHKDRNYILSIPVLLAQVEGIFSDILVLKGMAFRKNKKLYVANTGKPKLNIKGKPIEMRGLGEKISNSDVKSSFLLKETADLLVSHLLPQRNNILHGTSTSYAKPKLSLQLILLIFILAIEIEYLENIK